MFKIAVWVCNLITYPDFSFRKFAIYFGESIKECFIENSLTNGCIIWRQIFQYSSPVLPVHVKDNSQCHIADFINSVFQSSCCKLNIIIIRLYFPTFFKDFFISLLFHCSGSNLQANRFLQTLPDTEILFPHIGILFPHRIVCCHLQEAQLLFSNPPNTPKQAAPIRQQQKKLPVL